MEGTIKTPAETHVQTDESAHAASPDRGEIMMELRVKFRGFSDSPRPCESVDTIALPFKREGTIVIKSSESDEEMVISFCGHEGSVVRVKKLKDKSFDPWRGMQPMPDPGHIVLKKSDEPD
jgi:hypothetical protein